MNVSGVIFSPLEPKKQRSQKKITPDLRLTCLRMGAPPKVAGVMGPATPYTSTLLDKNDRGQNSTSRQVKRYERR